MQSVFTVRHTNTNERWQLCTYNRWQVKCCAEPFNNIGRLSFSPKGSASAARFSSVNLFPFTGAVIIRKNTLAQKDTKANRPYLFQNLLLTPHVPRVSHFNERKVESTSRLLRKRQSKTWILITTYLLLTTWAKTKQPN